MPKRADNISGFQVGWAFQPASPNRASRHSCRLFPLGQNISRPDRRLASPATAHLPHAVDVSHCTSTSINNFQASCQGEFCPFFLWFAAQRGALPGSAARVRPGRRYCWAGRRNASSKRRKSSTASGDGRAPPARSPARISSAVPAMLWWSPRSWLTTDYSLPRRNLLPIGNGDQPQMNTDKHG